MALWGSKDLVSDIGTIAIDVSAKTVSGNSTRFSSDGVSAGDVISVGAGATYGYAVIASVTDNTNATIHSVQYLVDPHNSESGTDVPAGASIVISQEPVYAMADSEYNAPELQNGVDRVVYGVSVAEQEETVDDSSQYHPAHAGWVGIQTHVDCHGNFRVKSEVLVAGSMITADADDDTVFPDA